ncbi:hypothetical protein OHB00_41485 [Streptomyces sp. NBC_00631]|uniref:hypothetical protein n=1 Tax=Streptomyces sp. NBC_00631 TaxID=2975793 RepID=UPI0030E543AF
MTETAVENELLIPHRVLLRAGENGDRPDQFRIGGQRPVHVGVRDPPHGFRSCPVDKLSRAATMSIREHMALPTAQRKQGFPPVISLSRSILRPERPF